MSSDETRYPQNVKVRTTKQAEKFPQNVRERKQPPRSPGFPPNVKPTPAAPLKLTALPNATKPNDFLTKDENGRTYIRPPSAAPSQRPAIIPPPPTGETETGSGQEAVKPTPSLGDDLNLTPAGGTPIPDDAKRPDGE